MTQLTQRQIEQLRDQLQQRRDALRGQIMEVLARTGEHPYGELAGIPDLGDASVADLLIDLDNAMIHRDVEEIRDIEAALERMDQGDYGTCIDCGLAIEFERLQAFPAARRCLPCQGQHEKTHIHDTTPTL
ncbi:MAG TPA: TraR/DksA C4-type zinc finger protein [Rhodocyclaceae bacterium]|nr:TraR/DksA C4-type zinc finger protein [Rhodocyclaceae bacterium]